MAHLRKRFSTGSIEITGEQPEVLDLVSPWSPSSPYRHDCVCLPPPARPPAPSSLRLALPPSLPSKTPRKYIFVFDEYASARPPSSLRLPPSPPTPYWVVKEDTNKGERGVRRQKNNLRALPRGAPAAHGRVWVASATALPLRS